MDKELGTSHDLESVDCHAGFHIPIDNIVVRESSSQHDRSVPNADLIRLSVRAFGWEVNRNGFQFKKKVLKRVVEDAFGEKIPMYRTYEGKLVDRNHIMKDSGGKQDYAIGFIESAYMKADGVYFDLWVWKRCITEEEQRQIRENEITVSMEVDYTKPVVILDGEELPSTPENRSKKGAVRSFADDAIVNGLGIAVLFDGITPGYASAKVVSTENALLNVTPDSADDTVPDNKERGSEAAAAELNPQEESNMQELETVKADLEARNAELAAANEALASKQLELQKIYEELEILRVQKFNDTVASHFDLGKLTADTAGWLLNMLRWSGDIEETCAKLTEIAGAAKNPGVPAPDTMEGTPLDPEIPDCVDGSCGECSACKKKKSEAAAAEAPTPEPVVDGSSAASTTTEVTPSEEPASEPETASELPVNIAAGSPAAFGSETPKWGIEHL